MAVNYVTIQESDFSSGMDSTTAESNIKETFVQDLQNAIPDAGGSIATRTGYITYGGGIPVRVVSAETISETKVRLTLDSSVTVANLSRQPVIVYGTSTAIKDDSVWAYFPKATTDIPVVVPPYDTNPEQADVVLEQYKTGISQKYVLLGISSTALGTPINSFLTLGSDGITVDPVNFTVTTRIVNNTDTSKYFFLYYIDPAVTGEAYHTADFLATGAGPSVWTTTASTVPNNNFIIRCYKDDGTAIIPDTLSFDDTTSEITASFSEDVGNGHMVVVAGETSSFFDAIVMGNAVTTINIEQEIAGDVLFVECYRKDALSNVYTLACPDDIQFDISQEYPLTVSFNNESNDSYTVRIIWRKGEQAARSVITVEYQAPHGIPVNTADYNPQLVVYGPDHSVIYTEGSGDRAGWVSFVDRYRTATEDRMVCGLGWNTFQCVDKSEILDGVSLPVAQWKVYPSLRSRVVALGTVYTGPAISNGTPRSTANIDTPDSTADGTLFATAITQSGTTITLATTLSGGTLTGTVDKLGRTVTIRQAPTTDLLGEHIIKRIATADDGLGNLTSIEFDIEIEKGEVLDYTRFNGAQVEWGIFTDELEVELPSMLVPGDKVELYGYASTYPNSYCLSAYTESSSNYVSVSNLTVRRQIPNRMLLLGTRLTKLIPLRPEFDDDTLDENLWLVHGDMIQIDDIATEERIRVVTTHIDITLTTPPIVTVSAGLKTVEVQVEGGPTFDTNAFKVGDLILLTNAGIFSGEYEIDCILSDTKFCTLPKATTAPAGTYLPNDTVLRGGLIEIWGEPISISDDAFNQSEIKVNKRWLPVDRADILGTYGTDIKQFSSDSYTEQEFVRTVVARDSMFQTNGVDPVYKFDGRNYHLAGLPRVNPCIMVSLNTAALDKIPFPAYSAKAAANVTQTTPWLAYKAQLGSAAGFNVGDAVQITGQDNTGSLITRISRIEVNGITAGSKEQVDLIEVDTALDSDSLSSALQIAEVSYRYYFKFLFIDRNNNIVQSATLGNQDIVVKLTESARVQFRLVGLPMVEQLDYARIEIEVYRTRKNESAPYYRIRNVEVPYPITNYIDIYDSTADALLTDLDYTTSALESQELSTGINIPPKARCITAASNRLLLGACTSTPRFTMTITDGQTEYATTLADYIGAKLEIKDCDSNAVYTFKFTNNLYSDFSPVVSESSAGISHVDNIATVTCTDVTGLVSGDWVYLTRITSDATSGNIKPRYAGWHKIIDVDADENTYTFAVNSAAITALDASSYDTDLDAVDVLWVSGGVIPVPTIAAGSVDYFMNTVEGSSDNPQIRHLPQLGRAINTVMALESAHSFWAEYGNDVTPLGTIIIKNICSDFSVQYTKPVPAIGYARVFINGTQMSGSTSGWIDAVTTFRGSRIVKSYPNYAECFDNPDAEDASTSSSIIDVNPADGETITAMIPMIGPSTTTASQLQGTVIVFKEKSIYAVDVERNSFEKLQTNGVGAPYPNSVSQTSGGLAFASTSGIYKIDRSLRISKISGPVDDLIKEAQTEDVSRLQGHSFTTENQYKLSLSNGSVIVYNYEREGEGKPGAWCEYTNHPVAGGWANSGSLELFASTMGRVFINRTSGTVKDYRDDSNTPIAFNVTFRATNFGDAAIRKQIRHVNVGFRNTSVASLDTAVSCGFDCSTNFTTLDRFTVESAAASSITQLRFGVPAGRVNYIQMRVQNSTIDQPIEITGITYKVYGLKIAGTEEAKSTRR